jgi:hypothetical protein
MPLGRSRKPGGTGIKWDASAAGLAVRYRLMEIIIIY